MLRKEQNDLITQTGPKTAMGDLFRRHWIPALLADELPANDCPPVRVKLLSERLVAFRDSEGRLGLIDEFCPHRGASLWFGRNEKCGLRCPYHGWKFDVSGQCVEVPSEPVESKFADKIKLKSYPLVERGGVLWTYMGPVEFLPPLPEWEFATVPAKHRFISKRFQECNYLQAMEGGIDSSHVSFLHSGNLESDPLFKGARGNYLMDREAQRQGTTYSGVEGIAIQDGSLQESMGPIVDRTKENLVSTDNGIIMARHRLMKAAKELAKGIFPPGVEPAHQKVRSASVILPPDQPFKDAAREALTVRKGVAPASV